MIFNDSIKKGISQIIEDNLTAIYCNTCTFEENDVCDFCHRKYMNWYPSEGFLKQLTEEICKYIE